MRHMGVTAHGIRLPIIDSSMELAEVVTSSLCEAVGSAGVELKPTDVLGVTESIVAKAQGNFASIVDIGEDVRNKFEDNPVGVVFPILSRNRFLNILKGISKGAKQVYVLLQYPQDEVGNPIMDVDALDDLEDKLDGLIPASEFQKITSNFVHPFTKADYVKLYESAGNNISVFFSRDPRDILKLTKHVLVAEIHSRFRTKKRLEKAGATTVYTLSDILSSSINGSGYNPDYGILGSNLSKDDRIKLFPRNCDAFVKDLRARIQAATGVALEVLIYGDGAFKDPICGIWELADPVVSPAYTEKLGGQPNEIKLKFVADNVLDNLSPDEKRSAITQMIGEKEGSTNHYNEGTTPRKYADLLGSLCDLMSGSGDKGTPVVLIRGYFDDYASK